MHRILSIGITLSLFIAACCYLPSCNEMQAAEMENIHSNNLIFALDAAELITTLEQNKDEFSGITISYKGDQLSFQKTITEGVRLKKVGVAEQPSATRVEIGRDGEIRPVLSKEYRTFEFWKANFDFTYFNWEDVKRLAEASETVYLSGSTITYGVSIHDPSNAARAMTPAFTLKLEGDFIHGQTGAKDGDMPDPVTLNGAPCPDYWDVINETEGG